VCQPEASMVMLVKPQFEAGRSEVGKGRGIITDPAIHERVKGEVADAFVASGCSMVDWAVSPITGADGNVEFLVWVTAPSDANAGVTENTQ
jgi:23S rRNA (cytidine1920-2'-O)/16S rRNA (cytidine1409-2'-O)-methyltransferase